MVINPIIGIYIPIIRIPIKGGMTIPNIATFDHGTHGDFWLPKPWFTVGHFYRITWSHLGVPIHWSTVNQQLPLAGPRGIRYTLVIQICFIFTYWSSWENDPIWQCVLFKIRGWDLKFQKNNNWLNVANKECYVNLFYVTWEFWNSGIASMNSGW